jgi:dTDP-4-dehydrorhamnose reductase
MYIILGKNGYIAQAIIAECKKRKLHFLALSRKDLDYTNFQTFSDYAHIHYNNEDKPFRNSTIINCAGYIGKPNVDACEFNKGDTVMGNVVFPTNLANFCTTNEATLAQISSGCIYNGHQKHFNEEDEPNFTFSNGSFYSGTKALCERMILEHNARSYIFRLRIPFSEHQGPRNYLTKLLTYDKLIDVENSLSHRGDFAQYCMDLLEAKVPCGIYNITNKGSVTTKRVVELLQKNKKTKKNFEFFDNLDTFLSEVKAPRSNCVLDTSKIEQYIKIRTVEEALDEAISKYESSITNAS